MNERITALSEWVQATEGKASAATTLLGLTVGLEEYMRKVAEEKEYILRYFPGGSVEFHLAMMSLSWACAHLTKTVMPDPTTDPVEEKYLEDK